MVTINAANEKTGASGKAMMGQGIGTASDFSTATFPSTAGSSGNIITSDGTNFVSSAPAGGSFISGYLSTSTGNPADSTTYYFAQSLGFIASTSAAPATVQIAVPVAFTLTKVYGSIKVAGVLGSASNCTVFIRVNNSSNTNITTTLQLTAVENTFSNTGLSISLNAGDYFSFGFTGPAWATNPTSCSIALGWSQ